MNASKTLAICVATCGREPLLLRLLQSLVAMQTPPGWGLELRLVNNRPRKPHSPQVRSVAERFPGRVRFLDEHEPNVASARNRALSVGAAHLIAFVDDDEAVEPTWLTELVDELARSSADAVFGPVLRATPAQAPTWIRETGLDQDPDRVGPLVWHQARTGNALVKGYWFFALGYRFDPSYGRSGGEDAELFGRLERAGARLHAAPRARVSEAWPPERSTLRWHLRRRWRSGITYHRLASRYDSSFNPLRAVAYRSLRGVVSLASGVGALAVNGRKGLLVQAALDAALVLGGLQGWWAPPKRYAAYGEA